MTGTLALVARRIIRASPARLFALWTTPEELVRWWGPRGVRCTEADVDLRVGGAYRIVNALPDGTTVTIRGVFQRIEPPHLLAYTWATHDAAPTEHVVVRFELRGDDTEVVVTHEKIIAAADRDGHAAGWEGCLDGLARVVTTAR